MGYCLKLNIKIKFIVKLLLDIYSYIKCLNFFVIFFSIMILSFIYRFEIFLVSNLVRFFFNFVTVHLSVKEKLTKNVCSL